MPRIRQFIASLKSNPLFAYEWRRVIGSPTTFLFRVTVCVTIFLLFANYIAPLFNSLKPNPPYTPLQKWMMFFGFAAGAVFLHPFNWLAAWMAWRSIEIEHTRRRAPAIAISLLGDWELFWAKFLPTAFFVACSSFVFIVLFDLIRATTIDFPYFPAAYIYLNIVITVALYPLRYVANILICYGLMLRWPSLRRSGVVVLLTLIIFGLCSFVFSTALLLTTSLHFMNLWLFVLRPLLENSIFIAFAWLLVLKIGPRARLLFIDESQLKLIKPRTLVKLRQLVRYVRRWRAD